MRPGSSRFPKVSSIAFEDTIPHAPPRTRTPRSPKAPDPQADQGTHVLRYGLLPHAHGWQAAGVVAAAAAFNTPLRVLQPPPQPPPAGAAAPYGACGVPAFGAGVVAGLAAGTYGGGGAGMVARGEYDPMQPLFMVRVCKGRERGQGGWMVGPYAACRTDEGRRYAETCWDVGRGAHAATTSRVRGTGVGCIGIETKGLPCPCVHPPPSWEPKACHCLHQPQPAAPTYPSICKPRLTT